MYGVTDPLGVTEVAVPPPFDVDVFFAATVNV